MFRTLESMPMLAAEGSPTALDRTWEFFAEGGVFMAIILFCSVIALMVIVYKLLALRRSGILPERLTRDVEHFEEHLQGGTVNQLQAEFRRGESALARLCAVATKNAGRTQAEVQDAVQSAAREEIVKMRAGLTTLDVVITIAPLLGLLGTASGLVLVFGSSGDLAQNPDQARITAGIARALGTTIAGIVVAVPSVIALSFFNRKIETMSARLEVLLGRVVSACHQQAFFQSKPSSAPAGQPAPHGVEDPGPAGAARAVPPTGPSPSATPS